MKLLVTLIAVVSQFHFAYATSLAAPIMENVEFCTANDSACNARNDAREADYNKRKADYDAAVGATTASTTNPTLAATGSATSTLQDAQEKNSTGKIIYAVAALGCTAAATYYGIQYNTCMAKPTPDKPVCNGHLVKAIAFGAFAVLATMQALKHDKVAHDACESQQQISSTGVSCGPAPADPKVEYPPVPVNPIACTGANCGGTTTTVDPHVTETCIQLTNDPTYCKDPNNTDGGGTNIRGTDGNSGFGSGTTAKNTPFKVNPDGTIIGADGQKFKLDDFKDEASMVAAGLPAAQASGIASNFDKALATGGLDAKKALADMNKPDSSFGGFGGGADVKVADSKTNGDDKDDKDMNGVNGADKDKNRKPAASGESLAKLFNGEMIGAAGDDIFKMMNRRYNLKEAQNTFMGQ